MFALMVARTALAEDRKPGSVWHWSARSPRSGFSPVVEESLVEHNYRLAVIRPRSLAKLPTSRLHRSNPAVGSRIASRT